MLAALLGAGIPVAYTAIGILCAKFVYRHMRRKFFEKSLGAPHWLTNRAMSLKTVQREWAGGIDSARLDARMFAFLTVLLWPVVYTVYACGHWFESSAQPGEKEARALLALKNAELERVTRENDERWRKLGLGGDR